ncbi:hypothetical protein COSO111634_37540 [Corallococcus soli]
MRWMRSASKRSVSYSKVARSPSGDFDMKRIRSHFDVPVLSSHGSAVAVIWSAAEGWGSSTGAFWRTNITWTTSA